jgi:GNAT superfamily N-acetyltransferase
MLRLPIRMSPRRLASLLASSVWLAVAAVVPASIFGVQAWCHYWATAYYFSGTGFVSEDSRIGYVGMPNGEFHHLVPPVYDAFTDDRGGRADRLGRHAPERVDVLFLGDSFTWGGGVQDEGTFPRLLADRAGLAVFNAAEPGYGGVAMALSIDKFADLRPRYIVFGFLNEQMWRNFSPCSAGGIFVCLPMAYLDGDWAHLEILPPLDNGHAYVSYIKEMLFPHSFGWRDVYWAAYRDVYMTFANRRSPNHPGAFWPSRGDAQKYFDRAFDAEWRGQGLRFLVERVVEKASALGAKVIFLFLPSDVGLSPPLPEVDAAIGDLRSQGTLIYVDTAPKLREAAALHGIDFVRLPGDGHPTATANEIIAEAIATAILQDKR